MLLYFANNNLYKKEIDLIIKEAKEYIDSNTLNWSMELSQKDFFDSQELIGYHGKENPQFIEIAQYAFDIFTKHQKTLTQKELYEFLEEIKSNRNDRVFFYRLPIHKQITLFRLSPEVFVSFCLDNECYYLGEELVNGSALAYSGNLDENIAWIKDVISLLRQVKDKHHFVIFRARLLAGYMEAKIR